jgi:hypothetical protein
MRNWRQRLALKNGGRLRTEAILIAHGLGSTVH